MPQTLFPAADPRAPVDFLSIDALAAHLMRQRPGLRLTLLPQTATDGARDFPVCAVFALKPLDEKAFADDPTGGADMPWRFQDNWLGFAAGDQAADPARLEAAFARVRTAGGLAA